jgi:hypothetical protein
MTSPVLALRAGMRALLVLDTTLTGLLGGERIYDEAPRDATPPYVTFAEASAKAWTGGEGRGHEHVAALSVWSRQGGDAEALAVAARIADLLDGATPPLTGHRMVLLRVSAQEIAKPTRDGWRRATVRLQGLTEQI